MLLFAFALATPLQPDPHTGEHSNNQGGNRHTENATVNTCNHHGYIILIESFLSNKDRTPVNSRSIPTMLSECFVVLHFFVNVPLTCREQPRHADIGNFGLTLLGGSCLFVFSWFAHKLDENSYVFFSTLGVHFRNPVNCDRCRITPSQIPVILGTHLDL